jgi:hypothetical protein
LPQIIMDCRVKPGNDGGEAAPRAPQIDSEKPIPALSNALIVHIALLGARRHLE